MTAVADLEAILHHDAVYRRPPRVQAPRIVEQLEQAGWLITRDPDRHAREQAATALEAYLEDPPSWDAFSDRIIDLLANGTAVDRPTVEAALTVLRLDPDEVRAVVIEQHTMHVYRWSDTRRGQTVPILKEPA